MSDSLDDNGCFSDANALQIWLTKQEMVHPSLLLVAKALFREGFEHPSDFTYWVDDYKSAVNFEEKLLRHEDINQKHVLRLLEAFPLCTMLQCILHPT
jgi:hypothetical protein